MPLEQFVVLGSIIEEIIAPIPSPIVMTASGVMAQAQGYTIIGVLLLGILGALGKTFGAWLFYVLGDKAEDIAVPRFGKFIGVTHEDLEGFGAHIGKGWKNDLLLILIRSVPIMPSTPVSVLCGIMKIRLSTFLGATFVGFVFRESFFLFLGYWGFSAYDRMVSGISALESILTIVMGILFLTGIGWLYWLRKTHHPSTWLTALKKRLERNA